MEKDMREILNKIYKESANAALKADNLFAHAKNVGAMEAIDFVARNAEIEIDRSLFINNRDFFIQQHKRINKAAQEINA